MAETPSPTKSHLDIDRNRDRTPELGSHREKRPRDDERERERDRHSSSRSHRRHREDETESEREERRKRRRERDGDHGRDYERSSRRHRDRSRESHRSHRSHRDDIVATPMVEMSREEKERDRERRDRIMADERRQQQRRERRTPPPPPSPPRHLPSPPKDAQTSYLDELDSESRSIFCSQLAARLTSRDLGLFFEDKLGRGAVRDARIVTDRVSRRSKGIGYVELDALELVGRAMNLSGTIVMGLPILIQQTEAERNRQAAAATSGQPSLPAALIQYAQSGRPPMSLGSAFPPLSRDLELAPGAERDGNVDARIPYHRLYVGGLVSSLNEVDVRQVFEAFGEMEFVDLQRDSAGRSKGLAYVQFKELGAAAMALEAMNGFEIAGRAIRVSTVEEKNAYGVKGSIDIEEPPRDYRREREQREREDERDREREREREHRGGGGSYTGSKMDATARQQLMFKLARTDQTGADLSTPKPRPVPAKPSGPALKTHFVLVNNVFDPAEETERNWDTDLAEDIKGEVETKYGAVERLKVEKNSAGEVYIQFRDQAGADKGVRGLNGRFFGGRELTAACISETLFKLHM